jgi:hypothetical protein
LDGALDLVGKAKGAGLFNLDQDLELQNLDCRSSPSCMKQYYALEKKRAQEKSKAMKIKLLNMDEELELQNLIGLKKVGKFAGKAGKAYVTKGLF